MLLVQTLCFLLTILPAKSGLQDDLTALLGKTKPKVEKVTESPQSEPQQETPKPPKIVYGEEAKPHEYPFQAAVITMLKDSILLLQKAQLCSGTVLSKVWILTAGHCLYNADRTYVLLGGHDLSNSRESYRMAYQAVDTVIHDAFNTKNYDNDIGLVLLPIEEVEFNKYVKLVKLPKGQVETAGKEGEVLGWGENEDGSHGGALKVADVVVKTEKECSDRGPHTICAFGIGADRPCFGDSGGPLLIDEVQVGIASFGATKCVEGTPLFFTRVDKYLNWIEDNTRISSAHKARWFSGALHLGFVMYVLI